MREGHVALCHHKITRGRCLIARERRNITNIRAGVTPASDLKACRGTLRTLTRRALADIATELMRSRINAMPKITITGRLIMVSSQLIAISTPLITIRTDLIGICQRLITISERLLTLSERLLTLSERQLTLSERQLVLERVRRGDDPPLLSLNHPIEDIHGTIA